MKKIEELLSLSDEELMKQVKTDYKRLFLSAHIRFSQYVPILPSVKEKLEVLIDGVVTKDRIKQLREELKKKIA